jgi:hypothetical protein
MSQDEHFYRVLNSGMQIVNVDAMVGAKWGRERLYVLFAGQQHMDISGQEAESIWAAHGRLSTQATGYSIQSGVVAGDREQ